MKRILIVDDSPLILAQLEDTLTAAGYEVVGKATSGQEAIQQAKGLQPDIVLMDVIMPGEIDGIEAAREIVEKLEIPVIFLTGHEEEDLIERIGNAGANGYILKPFRHAELKATIEIVLKKKEAEKRLKILYKDLVENTYDLIYVLDGRGNITFVNNTAVKTLGYSFEELTGRNIGDITTPESYRFLEDKFRRQVKAEDIGPFEIHLVDKDKNIRIFEVREQINRDGDRITDLFGIARDVTERRRGEKQHVLLSGLKEYLLGSYRFAEKLRCITDKIVEIFNADFARIWIIKPGDLCDFNCYHAGVTEGPHICRYRDRCLHLLASSGRYTHTDGEIHRRVPFDCYKIGKVASGIDPKFITNDVMHDPRVHNHTWAKELGLVSFAGYRLLSAAGDPVGVMALFSKQAISPEEDELLEDLANTTAQVIQTSRAEEILRQSEERFRNLFENSIEAVVTVDLRGKITSANHALSDMSGYTIEELVGTDYRELTSQEEVQRIYEAYNRLYRTGEPIRGMVSRMIHRTGEVRTAQFYVNLVRKGNEIIGFQATIRDVTEKQRMETALKESEQRLKLAVDAAQIGLWDWDIPSGRVTRNERWFRMLGYSHDEIEPTVDGWRTLVHPDDLAESDRSANEHLAAETPFYQSEFRMRNKSGDYIWILDCGQVVEWDKAGKPVRALGTHIDITERKRTEEALRKSEQRSTSLLEAVPDLMFVLTRDGTYVDFKADRDDELAIPRTEIIGKNIRDIGLSKEHLESAFTHIERAIATNTVQEFEYDLMLGNELTSWSARMVALSDREVFVLARNITERKKADEVHRESEERYRALYEDNPSMYFTVSEEGTVLSVNPYGAEQLGYTVDELIGQSVLQVFHEEDRDPVTEQLRACLTKPGQVARWEFRKIRKDGTMLWVREAARAVSRADGKPVVLIVCEDITVQKRAEEDLRKSEQRYRLLAENANDIIFTADMDLKITYVSPSVNRVLGFTVEEVMAQTPAEILTPGSLEVVMNAYREELELEARGAADPVRTRILELELYRKDGSTIYTETAFSGLRGSDGKPFGIIGITRDITERKQAEKALRESEMKFRSVFETSRDFMYISSLDGKIIDYNLSAKEFFGYSDEEIGNMTILDVYQNPEDRAKLVEKLKAEGFVDNYELRLKKKDGSSIDGLATITVRRDSKGDIIGFQGSVKDVTQMKRLEQQLMQAEKLSGLGTMISGVAHEINNPLTAIMGNAEFLLMRKEMPKDSIKSLKVILKESERTAKIVSGLLTFAREHKQEREMTSINDIVIESYRLREYNLRVSNINVRLSLADDLPPTYADPYQLQQVFTNIINNARDALRDKGGGALTIRSVQKGENLIIEFEDNGPGISKENLKRIFDPFFTTKDVGKGTGLGLSMAYGIINEHGGRIDVESEPGRGTKFIVSIPVVSSRRKEKKATTEKKIEQTGKRILVVDDEEYLRNLLSDVLSEKGHIVTTSSSGQEALTLIGKESFDAILLDIKMPGMEGKELYTHIHNSYPEMVKRILFITGDTLSGETQAFLKVFENRYIAKPFRIEALYRILNQVLEQ